MKVLSKPIELGALKLNVPYQVFESFDEAAKSAGGADVLLNKINSDVPVFNARRAIVDVVSRLTGVPFITVGKKNKTTGAVKQVRDTKKDSDSLYINRALKAKPVEVAAIEAELAKSDKLAINLGPRAASIKPSKQHIAAAADVLDGKNNRSLAKVNEAFAKFGLAAFTPSGNRDLDLSSLAGLIRDYKAKTAV